MIIKSIIQLNYSNLLNFQYQFIKQVISINFGSLSALS